MAAFQNGNVLPGIRKAIMSIAVTATAGNIRCRPNPEGFAMNSDGWSYVGAPAGAVIWAIDAADMSLTARTTSGATTAQMIEPMIPAVLKGAVAGSVVLRQVDDEPSAERTQRTRRVTH